MSARSEPITTQSIANPAPSATAHASQSSFLAAAGSPPAAARAARAAWSKRSESASVNAYSAWAKHSWLSRVPSASLSCTASPSSVSHSASRPPLPASCPRATSERTSAPRLPLARAVCSARCPASSAKLGSPSITMAVASKASRSARSSSPSPAHDAAASAALRASDMRPWKRIARTAQRHRAPASSGGGSSVYERERSRLGFDRPARRQAGRRDAGLSVHSAPVARLEARQLQLVALDRGGAGSSSATSPTWPRRPARRRPGPVLGSTHRARGLQPAR